MKVLKLEQNSDEWFDVRKGKITGSKLKDIVVKRGTGRKVGFYQLIADRIAIEPDDEDAMERGHRLELEAIERFEKETGLKTEQVGMWISDDDNDIAVSPDAVIGNTEAVEVKCWSPARHLQAYLEDKIPNDIKEQALQYFVVNPDLKRLHVVFYDPRIPSCDYHSHTIDRSEVHEDAENLKEYQLGVLKEVREIVERLAF